MGHGNKIPTIKASKNPNRSISEIVKKRKKMEDLILGCFNCKHRDKMIYETPCFECERDVNFKNSNWEKREK